MKELLTRLFAYNQWANRHILEGASQLDQGQLLGTTPFSHGSLQNLLFHMLRTEWVWRNLAERQTLPPGIPLLEEFPTLNSIKIRWESEAGSMHNFLLLSNDADLSKIVEVSDRRGVEHQYAIYQMLAHIILHGMQHRSEAAAILTGYGRSPGDMDFIFYNPD